MKSCGSRTLQLVLAFWLWGGARLDAVPTIDHILVSQAIQEEDPTKLVPLVAGRSAVVRAKIGGTGVVSSLTATLDVSIPGTILSRAPDLRMGFSAPGTPDYDFESNSLNFEVNDIGFLTQPPGTVVTFKVTLSTGATLSVSRTLVSWRKPKFYYLPIQYDPPGPANFPPPPADLIAPGRGDAMMKTVLPVQDFDPDLYRLAPYPAITYPLDPNGNSEIDIGEESGLLTLLEGQRQVMVTAGLGASPDLYLFGWIENNTVNGSSGYSPPPPANVGFGEANPVRFQRTYAHELCHQLGISPHSARTLVPDTGWDVGARLPGNPSGSGVAGHVKKRDLYGIMKSGVNTNQAWMDLLTYTRILNNVIVTCPNPECLETVADLDDPTPFVISIRGVFEPTGTKLLEPLRVFRYPWLSKPTPQSRQARFVVEVTGEKGRVEKRLFEARRIDERDEADDKVQGPETYGFFSVMVPFRGRADRLRILDRNGNTEITQIDRSPEAPRVTISAPAKGSQLPERAVVAWGSNDPDTPENEVLFQVAYSYDGGRSFVPLGIDLKERRLEFNPRSVPAAKGNGLIRVFASDGLNTSYADVEGLTLSGGPPGE